MDHKFREDRVILIGDTHSTDITHQILTKKIPNRSDVVHIGDGGWGFGKPSYAIDNARAWADKINRICQDADIKLYHIIGNHDNPDCWNIWNTEAYSHLKFVKTGDVGVFPNGKKALFIGGGISIDRFTRKEGVDYWKEELTPQLETVEQCDFVFSHDAPEQFNHSSYTIPISWAYYHERDIDLLDDAVAQRKVVGDIVDRSGAKIIIGGHFHNGVAQEIDGVKYRCLNINEIYEFK